jgi:predicted PurR-regulated permease PerM
VTTGPTTIEWQRAVVALSGTVIAVVAVCFLYWAQSIFIPVALAVFLTFLLNPVVSRLRLRGLGRTPAVILTVWIAGVLLASTVWIVTSQVSRLLRELPEHTVTLRAKVKSLKTFVGAAPRIGHMVQEINRELSGLPPAAGAGESESGQSHGTDQQRPRAVIVEPERPIWLERITNFLSPMMECLAQLALAIILVIFMLEQREEFRNRVIKLVGYRRIASATKFVDEAGQRISRFLLMQALVNGTFGLVLGLGLLALGVRYALLWGFLAAMLRYLPYVGPFLAAVLPVSTSLALTPGWTTTLLVIGLFLTLELVVANVIEPWLYGQSMGVSAIALLVSAAFWAFLWGPVGLVLSSPLTVCLVVLGRYVPQLEFLAVLLGDEPALELKDSFYQRLLARDQDEAEDLILERLKTEQPEGIFDEMVVPALCSTRRSRVRGEITETDERAILRSVEEIVDDLGEIRAGSVRSEVPPAGSESGDPVEPEPPFLIFGCPARDDADSLALVALEKLLDASRWRMKVIAPETLTSELLEMVACEEPAVICIGALPPGGLAHARYLCKRLRARFPDLRIIVGRFTEEAGEKLRGGDLEEAGASSAARSLLETRQQLQGLIPLLEPSRAERSDPGAATARTTAKPAPANSRRALHHAAAKELASRPTSQ